MICIECKEAELIGQQKKFCSDKCRNRDKSRRHYNRKGRKYSYVEQICLFCKNSYRPTRHKQKYCGVKCSADAQRKFLDIPDCIEGANRSLDKNLGYVRVYVPMHPEANTWGYVYEHRLVAEQMIGRRLSVNEVVHHKNGKRWDNRPDNLEILTDSEHSKLHAKEKRLTKL